MTPAQSGLIQKLDNIIAQLSELTDLLEASFDDHPQLDLDVLRIEVGKTYIAENGHTVQMVAKRINPAEFPILGECWFGDLCYSETGEVSALSDIVRNKWRIVREA